MRWQQIGNIIEGYGWEESGAVIYPVLDGTFDLYSYNYGGDQNFEGNFPDIDSAKKEAESWT